MVTKRTSKQIVGEAAICILKLARRLLNCRTHYIYRAGGEWIIPRPTRAPQGYEILLTLELEVGEVGNGYLSPSNRNQIFIPINNL